MRPSGAPDSTKVTPAHVYLVGAGPGDPDLLTRKAERLIRSCDALVFDYLVAPEILDWAPAEAEKICVGKRAGFHSVAQEKIQDVLVRLSLSGKTTVRLKGGDPFIFGRGGEEVSRLRAQDIPFEVVPAVTAGIAAAARAVIPLTHRSFNSSVVFITGHQDPTKEETSVDWAKYANLNTTLCLYMAVGRLAKICDALMSGGLPATTPCAIVQWATMPAEKKVFSTLEKLPLAAEQSRISSPAIIIIGSTAREP